MTTTNVEIVQDLRQVNGFLEAGSYEIFQSVLEILKTSLANGEDVPARGLKNSA